jgi:hypothetical protein
LLFFESEKHGSDWAEKNRSRNAKKSLNGAIFLLNQGQFLSGQARFMAGFEIRYRGSLACPRNRMIDDPSIEADLLYNETARDKELSFTGHITNL